MLKAEYWPNAEADETGAVRLRPGVRVELMHPPAVVEFIRAFDAMKFPALVADGYEPAAVVDDGYPF